jgi:hypothetical protein
MDREEEEGKRPDEKKSVGRKKLAVGGGESRHRRRGCVEFSST